MSVNNHEANRDVGLEPLRGSPSAHMLLSNEATPPPPYHHDQRPLPRQVTWRATRPHRAPSFPFILVSAFSVMAAVIVIITLARSIELYSSTHNSKIVTQQGFVTPIWPLNGIDLTTTALLLSGAIVMALQTISTVIAGKKIELRSHRIAIVISSLVAIGLLLAAIVLFKINVPGESLYARSCDLKTAELVWDGNEIGLSKICNALTAGWAFAITSLVLKVASLMILWRSAAAPQGPRARRNIRQGRNKYLKVEDRFGREPSPEPMAAQQTDYLGHSAESSVMLGHVEPRYSRDSGDGA